jgi:hypothetical protein
MGSQGEEKKMTGMSGSTGVPSAVQKQAEEAEKALDALADQMRSEEAAMAPEESAVETTSNTKDDFAEPVKPQAATPAEPVKAEEKVVEDAETKAELEKLKQQFAVLQGKYNSELPRYAETVRELTTQNDSLKDELDEAKDAAEKAQVDAEAYKKYLTPEEQEDLENTFAEFNSRISRGVAEDVMASKTKAADKRMDELQKKIDELNEAQYASQATRFWEDADRLAPGLKAANESGDPGWISFLDKVDPVSHISYRDIGTSAVGRGDFEAVANLYSLYKGPVKEEPAKPRRTAESQVKPESSSSAPTTQQQQGRFIPQSEIEKFYNDAARNGLPPSEIAKKEAEYDQAAEEGRILFGK